ncbi:hypothetical protein H8356DRAFT_1356255 [Neocallimastix lanati (nom. inval.)]|nr:hypothetical protein H8356DRAFT_1356255 [Neocallimastix sp. JGI-2020a]
MKITQVLHKTDILKIKDIFYFSSSCKNNICTQVDSDFLKEFVEIPDKDGDLCKRNKECGSKECLNHIVIVQDQMDLQIALLFNENKCLYLDDIENGKFKQLGEMQLGEMQHFNTTPLGEIQPGEMQFGEMQLSLTFPSNIY